nr:hypothetical protein [Brucella intermedia]
MKNRILTTSAIFIALLTLSACQESPPEITDDQVLDLFGSKSSFSSNDAPATISKQTEECARLLAGLDSAVYKDMPEEMLGSIKTACRKNFQEIIADTQRNTFGLKLEHMENVELAEQITRARAQSIEKAKAAAQAKRGKEAAEKLAKDQEAIAAAKKKASLLETSLDDHLAALKEKCAEWKTTMVALKERKLLSVASQLSPNACYRNYEENIRRQARNIIEQVSKLEAKPDSIMGPAIPYFGVADPESMNQQVTKVEEAIASIKAEAAAAELRQQ